MNNRSYRKEMALAILMQNREEKIATHTIQRNSLELEQLKPKQIVNEIR